MSERTVTVLICTRDRPEQLTHCLESILKIRYSPLELIVVDNASHSFSIPQLEYRIPTRFYSYPVPGLSRARNSVLSEVHGEVVAVIDDDAVADPDWLTAAVPPFNDPAIGCVTGSIEPLETKSSWQQRQVFEQPDTTRLFDQRNFDPLTSSPGKGSNVLIRKECLQKIGFPTLFGPGTPACAADEHYLFHQIIRLGWKICYEPGARVYHDFVSTEEQYIESARQRAISRGAFLTKFVLSEAGFRLQTLKYLLRRIVKKSGAKSDLPISIRNLGLVLGPFALVQSLLYDTRAHRSISSTLLSDSATMKTSA